MPAHDMTEAAAFTAIWMLLILVTTVIVGTLILRKYQTPIAVGVLLGVSSMVRLCGHKCSQPCEQCAKIESQCCFLSYFSAST